MDNTVVLSTLTLTGFNVTGNGFYWCSVSSNDSNILTPNPSRVVRIRHQNECHSNGNQENCDTEVIALYEPSNKSCGIRCADQDINVNIIEAQICPQTSTTGIITCLSTSQYVAAINSESDIPTKTVISVPESTISSTVNWTFSSKPTMTISNSNPANIWIPIGASISCAILAFYFTAGVIIICVINHRKQGQYMLSGVTSPFDDIHMDTFTSDSMLQEKDSNKNRVSNILFETNVSYECTRTAISHSNDNIYETIQ